MGRPGETPRVKPIVGILAASQELLDPAREAVSSSFGAIETATAPSRWTASDYYRNEIGDAPWRQFVALAELREADGLVEWKLESNRLEERWRASGRRRVNLDPGYVDLGKLVLATTKDASHRLYLGRGIYAEATLHFAAGGFRAWPYTYADYAAADSRAFFNRVRERLREQRRSSSDPRAGRAREAPSRSPG